MHAAAMTTPANKPGRKSGGKCDKCRRRGYACGDQCHFRSTPSDAAPSGDAEGASSAGAGSSSVDQQQDASSTTPSNDLLLDVGDGVEPSSATGPGPDDLASAEATRRECQPPKRIEPDHSKLRQRAVGKRIKSALDSARDAERGAPRQRRDTDRTPVGPVAQVPRARLDLQRSLPPPSAAHHHVVCPRAVFTTPLAPTGTIFAASMATIDCHFDFPLLRVRHGLSNPRIHVVRACVPMSPIPSNGRFNTLLPALRVPPRC